MNASEFCRALADRIGVKHNSILIYDRALSTAGLRGAARGRHAPPIGRAEALNILLAFMSGATASLAPEAAKRLAGAMECGTEGIPDTAYGLLYDLTDVAHLEDSEWSLIAVLSRICGALAKGKDHKSIRLVVDSETSAEVMIGPFGLLFGDVRKHAETPAFYRASRTATGSLLKWIGEVT